MRNNNESIYEFVILPKPPYNFQLSMNIFRYFNEENIDKFDGINYYRAIIINQIPFILKLSSIGTTTHPRIKATVFSKSGIEIDTIKKSIIEITNQIINSDLDLTKFYQYFSKDKIISPLCKNYYGLKPPRTPTIFEAIIIAILEQQVNLSFAIRLKNTLALKYGLHLSLNDINCLTFPKPQALFIASIDDIHSLHISRRKAEYIIDVSKLIINGELNLKDFEVLPNERIIDILTKIRGIGLWTAEYILVRGLGRLDAIPADDMALRNSLSSTFSGNGKKLSSNEVRKMSLRWGKYSGYVGYYFLTDQRFKSNPKEKGY